jgi:hypothetical protein
MVDTRQITEAADKWTFERILGSIIRKILSWIDSVFGAALLMLVAGVGVSAWALVRGSDRWFDRCIGAVVVLAFLIAIGLLVNKFQRRWSSDSGLSTATKRDWSAVGVSFIAVLIAFVVVGTGVALQRVQKLVVSVSGTQEKVLASVNAALEKSSSQMTPTFVPRIERIRVGDLSPQKGSNLPTVGFVFATASVCNTGADGSVLAFGLLVKLPDGSAFLGESQTIPERVQIRDETGQAEWVAGADALNRRAITPIPRGTVVRGQLWYFFPNLRSQQLRAPGLSFTLLAIDVWGKVHSGEMKSPGLGSGDRALDFPGLMLQSELQKMRKK